MRPTKLAILAAAVATTASCATDLEYGGRRNAQGFLSSDLFYATHDQQFLTVGSRHANIYPPEPSRAVAEQDCSAPLKLDQGNLRCR